MDLVQMPIQIDVLAERTVAIIRRAFARLIAGMRVVVSVARVLGAKRLIAIVAFERFVASVRVQVLFEHKLCDARLSADIAHELPQFIRADSIMMVLIIMPFAATLIVEFPLALGTFGRGEAAHFSLGSNNCFAAGPTRLPHCIRTFSFCEVCVILFEQFNLFTSAFHIIDADGGLCSFISTILTVLMVEFRPKRKIVSLFSLMWVDRLQWISKSHVDIVFHFDCVTHGIRVRLIPNIADTD